MPNELNLAKTFFIISAILNILVGVSWVIYTIIIGAFTCGIGCLFGFLPAVNIIACIMDFIAYSRLSSLDRTGTFSTIQFSSIFDIITIITGNIISCIFGIFTLVNLNNEDIKSYLNQKGIY